MGGSLATMSECMIIDIFILPIKAALHHHVEIKPPVGKFLNIQWGFKGA